MSFSRKFQRSCMHVSSQNSSQTSMILGFRHRVLEGMHAEVLWTSSWRYYSNSREGNRTRDQSIIKQTCYQPGHSGPTCFSKYLLHHNSNLGTQGHFHTKVTFSTTTQSTWLLRLVIPSINFSKHVTCQLSHYINHFQSNMTASSGGKMEEDKERKGKGRWERVDQLFII